MTRRIDLRSRRPDELRADGDVTVDGVPWPRAEWELTYTRGESAGLVINGVEQYDADVYVDGRLLLQLPKPTEWRTTWAQRPDGWWIAYDAAGQPTGQLATAEQMEDALALGDVLRRELERSLSVGEPLDPPRRR